MLEKILKKIGYIKERDFLRFIQIKNDSGQWIDVDRIPKENVCYRVINISRSGVPTVEQTNVKV